MAVVVFDMTIGQWAGVPITTTGKSRPPNDGTTGYAMLVSPVDPDGNPVAVGILNAAGGRINPMTDETGQDIVDALNEPVAYLPLPVAAPTSDTTLTHLIPSAITTGTTTSLVAATSSQYTRVYRLILTCTGANVLTFKSASNAISQAFTIPSTGGILTLDFTGYWWWTTAVNEALQLTTTTTATVTMDLYYIKGT